MRRAQRQEARSGPPRRAKIAPVPPSAEKASGSVPDIHAWLPRRDDFVEQRGPPQRVEVGRRSRRAAGSARRLRGAGRRGRSGRAPGRSAGPSARPWSTPCAGISLGPWPTSRSERCGPSSVRPAARSRSRAGAQRCAVVVLDLDGGHALARSASSVPTSASSAHGKRRRDRARVARAPIDGGQLGDGRGARRGDGDAGLGHDALERLEARGVAHVVGQQPVALLHGALEAAEQRAIAGIEARRSGDRESGGGPRPAR